jgi:hypothetical protein
MRARSHRPLTPLAEPVPGLAGVRGLRRWWCTLVVVALLVPLGLPHEAIDAVFGAHGASVDAEIAACGGGVGGHHVEAPVAFGDRHCAACALRTVGARLDGVARTLTQALPEGSRLPLAQPRVAGVVARQAAPSRGPPGIA